MAANLRVAISARAALPLHYLKNLPPDAPVAVYQLMGLGRHPLYGTRIPIYTLFVDKAARGQENVRYIPCTYGSAEHVLRHLRPHKAVIACAMRGDLVSWGVSWDVSGALYECAEEVVLEVNDQMPFTGEGTRYTHGEIVRVSYPLPEYPGRAREEMLPIARKVAEMIPPGATVQVGVGSFPESVCLALQERGVPVRIWTEAFSDPLMSLCERGLVVGKPTAAFLWGTKRLYDWAAEAALDMRPLSEVNNGVGLRSPLYSILGALEVDWQGNANAEVLGGKRLAGVGGYCDFAALAWKSGGRVIVGLPARRIVERVQHVTLPGHYADLVVTERGVADLRGVPEQERPALLRAAGS